MKSKSQSLKLKKLKNKFYIKYFIKEAGNDSKKINSDLTKIIKQLESLL